MGRAALKILRDYYAGKGKPRVISLYTELHYEMLERP